MPSLLSFLTPLDHERLAQLAEANDASIDESLRVPPSVQVARVLVETTARDAAQTRQLLLASRRGDAEALARLHTLGVLWPRSDGGWSLPWALELAIGEGARRGPRSFAALYARIEQEGARNIARARGFPWLQAPRALSLETLWGEMRSPEAMNAQLASLSDAEREVLVRIGEEGGEVTGHELADLERNPSRVATTSGVWSRRGASFALNRRGFLLPMGLDRHIVPEEVLRAVMPESFAAGQAAQAHAEDNLAAPADALRAQYTHMPGALLGAIVLLAMANRNGKAPRVLPTSRVNAVAARLDSHTGVVAMLYSLAFEAGWLRAVASPTVGTGPALSEASEPLLRLWLRSAGWDETFLEPDRRRAPEGPATDGAGQALREIVLEHVRRAAVGRWVRLSALVQACLADTRSTRLLKAIARRKLPGSATPEQAVTRMVSLALHTLGELDIAESAEGALCRRATRTAKNQVEDDTRRLLTRPSARACDFAGAADLLDPVSWDGALRVTLHEDRVREAFIDGKSESELQVRLARCLPDATLAQDGWRQVLARGMSAQGRAQATALAYAIDVQDASVATSLYGDKTMAGLLAPDAPAGWIFVRAGADSEKVMVALRTRGVHVQIAGA